MLLCYDLIRSAVTESWQEVALFAISAGVVCRNIEWSCLYIYHQYLILILLIKVSAVSELAYSIVGFTKYQILQEARKWAIAAIVTPIVIGVAIGIIYAIILASVFSDY